MYNIFPIPTTPAMYVLKKVNFEKKQGENIDKTQTML